MQVDVFCPPAAVPEADVRGTPLAAAFVLSCHEQIPHARLLQPVADSAQGSPASKARAGAVGFGTSLLAFWYFDVDCTGAAPRGPRTLAPAFTISTSELGGRVLGARSSAPQAPAVLALGPLAQPSFVKVAPSASQAGKVTVEPISPLGRGRTTTAASKAAGEPAAEAALSKARAADSQKPTVLGPLEAVARRQLKRKRPGAGPDAEAEAEAEDEDDFVNAKRAAMLPQGSGADPGGLSMAPMVRQGLRAKDYVSLNKVLHTGDKRVMDSTVAQLSGHEAFDLLQECVSRLMSHHHYSQRICGWMQRVLLRHCAYINSRPLLQRALQPLHDVFEARCSTHRSLALLRGRLQLARDCGMQVIAGRRREQETVRAPLLEYLEGDEDLAEEATSEAGAEVAEESGDALDSDEDLMDEWLDLDGD